MSKRFISRMCFSGLLNGATYIRMTIILLLCHQCDSLCTFPTDFQDSVWTSTSFGTMTFTTSNVTITETPGFGVNPAPVLLSWDCFLSSSTKLIIRTTTTYTSFGQSVYSYYCILFTKQNSDNYYYEASEATLLDTSSLALTDAQCQTSNDASSLHVMLKDGAAAKQVCAQPILGSFTYTVDPGTGTSCSNGTWDSACSSDKSTITVNKTASCSPQVFVGYSSEGTIYCLLEKQSSNTYYQILYNPGAITGTETRTFSCLTITTTNTGSDGNTTISIEQRSCDDRTSASPIVVTLTSDVLCPVIGVEETTTTTVAPVTPSDNTPVIVGAVVGALGFLILLGLLILLIWYCKRDPYAGKTVIENTKPRFEDPDETLEDLEMVEASTPVTRDDITVDAFSPTNITNTTAIEVPNGNIVNRAPGKQEDFLSTNMNGSVSNGYIGKEIANYFHEKPGDRPVPRVHKLTPGKESMVIFNGDERVISGNDSRVITTDNPTARSMRMDQGGVLTFKSIDEDGTGDDYEGRISSENIGELPYPSIPREKSNLMPPIETIDSPKQNTK